MSEHHSEAAFLRRIILYDDSDEGCKLEKSIAQVLRDVRCVQRVASVTAVFPLLALAFIAYGALLHRNFPYDGSALFFRVLCELGLASLICLAGLAGLLTLYRKKLKRLRKEGLRRIIRLLESHLGEPPIPRQPSRHRVFHDSEAFQGSTDAGI
jgi:hypothetical protein